MPIVMKVCSDFGVFCIVFKCYIISINDQTDVAMNELFQTITGIDQIYVHTIYIYNRLPIKWSGKFPYKSGKKSGKNHEPIFFLVGTLLTA